jgi:DNA topoisomerase IB
MSDYSDLATLAEFGEEISATAQTVKTWLDKHNESATEDGKIKPLRTFGNTNVYSRKSLMQMAAERGNTQAIKTAGYVHPDKFKESEDARIRLAGELASLQADYAKLDSQYNELMDGRRNTPSE